jgi:hypothetical protein
LEIFCTITLASDDPPIDADHAARDILSMFGGDHTTGDQCTVNVTAAPTVATLGGIIPEPAIPTNGGAT